jgi:sugar phosphate isomerase/epimerase
MQPLPQIASSFSRREFVAKASLGLAAACVLPAGLKAESSPAAANASAESTKGKTFEIAAFEKHFYEKYSPDELAQTCDEMDLHVELTVRPEGHVKPVNAAEELPVFVEALGKRNRRILIIATSFVRPDEPHLEQTLRAARKLGIRQYRHRGFSYVPGTPIKAQVANFRVQAREFAAMNREIGITALYQNHAGANAVGAAIWDIDAVLDDIDPDHFGLALDTRHLLVEQGRAWPTAVRLIAPRVRSLFVKSFRWDRDKTVETPLADGIVTKAMIDQIMAGHSTLPVCLHVEHVKLQPVPFAERAGIVKVFRDDARVLRNWLGLIA